MAGVRIHHAVARNCRFTVVEGDKPYPIPYVCTPPEFGGCGSTHLFKTHHLNLDENGAVILGDVLYQRLRALLALNGFAESNIVAHPPTLGIGLSQPVPGRGQWGNIPIITGHVQGVS
jgi:hypothetical protein